jgi:hypothetical protein
MSLGLRQSPAMSRGTGNQCSTTEVAAARQETASVHACERNRGHTCATVSEKKEGEREGPWG